MKTTENPSIRQALACARTRAREARGRGSIYSVSILLRDGRTLSIHHAPAAGGGELFGAWVYTTDTGNRIKLGEAV